MSEQTDKNYERVMRLAEEAGLVVHESDDPNSPPSWHGQGHNEQFEKFAALCAQSSTAAAHPGASASVCPTCGGNGNHRLARTEPLPCETCAGIGYVALSATASAESAYERARREHPEAGRCKCGQHGIPARFDGINWYWQRHSREGCTLELPNSVCWCGLLRHEHTDGHQKGVESPLREQNDIQREGKK